MQAAFSIASPSGRPWQKGRTRKKTAAGDRAYCYFELIEFSSIADHNNHVTLRSSNVHTDASFGAILTVGEMFFLDPC